MAAETVSIEGVVAGGDILETKAPVAVEAKEGPLLQSPAVPQQVPLEAAVSTAPVSTVRGASPVTKPELNGTLNQSTELADAVATTQPAAKSAVQTPQASHVRQSPPGSGPSEEAAALLLNFSTVGDHVPLPAIAENEAYSISAPVGSPITSQTPAPLASLVPSSPRSLPTPSAISPEASASKPKQKRKRTTNAVAGPSRQSSVEPGQPAHSMGEENTLIRCICGFVEDDGFTIQCEGCYAWEHGQCFGYPQEDSVPDIYYCELCDPRPVDTTAARLVQLQSRATWETRRLARVNEIVALEQAKKSRAKPKRPRTDSGKENEPQDDNQDPALSGSTPSGTKPRRKPNPNKQRSRPSEGSIPYTLKGVPEDDDYFRSMPWELEYTPIKDNVIRGVAARHAVSQLYREWVEGEDSPPPTKRQQQPYHASGLPSPTDTGLIRLSPDNLLSPPDFSILSPPVPPVFLSGPDLASLASPTSIRPVEDSACFLPLKYSEPSSGIYARPTIYGIFTQDVAAPGTFFGDYRCEVLDTATYRRDAINQYSALGIPKPYVHSIGPPVNLMLDARSYGNEMRLVRSGCHPNAVIRPVFHRFDKARSPKLVFGVFASRELAKNEEIVLAWEWDDQHVVHTLRAIIDSTLKNSGTKPLHIAPETVEYLTTKFDTILTNALGTFQSCACVVNTDCAFAQMRRLVNGQTFHGVSGARARKRIDLGELVGAVRGWRRRELEAAAASGKARRFRTSGEWDVWRAGPISGEGDDVNTRSCPPQSASSEGNGDEDTRKESPTEDADMDADPQEPLPEREVKSTAPSGTPSDDEPDDAMEVDVAEDSAENARVAGPSTPKAADVKAPIPSSVLSSLPSEGAAQRGDEGEEELSSGHESDATTITLARSQFSDGDSETEERRPSSDRVKEVRPVSVHRGRRVVSPAEELKPARTSTSKATTTPRKTKDGKRRPRKNVIASSDEDASSEDDELPARKAAARPRASLISKGRRRAAPRSDSEDEPPRKSHKSLVMERKKAKRTKIMDDLPSSPAAAEAESAPEPLRESSPAPQPEVNAPVPAASATVTDIEPSPPPKEPTPPPKEKEPTPPPPKKVSMKEYLATHKIRKVSNPAITDIKPDVAEESASIVTTPSETGGSAASGTAVTTATPAAPGGSIAPVASSATQPPRLNLMEHLPSSRGASLTPRTPFTPTTPNVASGAGASTTSSAYVPRTDYFGSQPAASPSAYAASPSTVAYVPRQSSSYVPRQPEEAAPLASPATPAYVPRPVDKDQLPIASPVAARQPLPQQTPPRASHSLPEIPSALGVREGPPHYVPRPPPTGPRIPPTGPRGGWSGPAGAGPASNTPLRGGFQSRGGFGRGFERGFGFRGRGLRGRGRGM